MWRVRQHHPDGLRGLYEGTPTSQRTGGEQPSRITLYLDQFMDLTVDHVQHVVRHEFGHHLGFTDEELSRL